MDQIPTPADETAVLAPEEERLETIIQDLNLEEEEADDTVPCPSCGHVNPPQKLFCEECGAALDEEETLEDDFDLLDDSDLDL